MRLLAHTSVKYDRSLRAAKHQLRPRRPTRLASKRICLEPARAAELKADASTVLQFLCSRHASGPDASTARLANAGAARLSRCTEDFLAPDREVTKQSSFTRPLIEGGSDRLRTWTLSGRGAARYRAHSE